MVHRSPAGIEHALTYTPRQQQPVGASKRDQVTSRVGYGITLLAAALRHWTDPPGGGCFLYTIIATCWAAGLDLGSKSPPI